jgi:hypothetical protein
VSVHFVDESQRVKPVSVLAREPILRREPVVDGDDDGAEFSVQLARLFVDRNRVGLADDEATAVEEHDDGHAADDVVWIAASGGGRWVVEAEPEDASRVDGGVGGGNAIGGIERGSGFEVEEVERCNQGLSGALPAEECDAVVGGTFGRLGPGVVRPPPDRP